MTQFFPTRGALLGAACALVALAAPAGAQTYPPGTNCQSLLPGLRANCISQARSMNSGTGVIPNSAGANTVQSPGTNSLNSGTTVSPNGVAPSTVAPSNVDADVWDSPYSIAAALKDDNVYGGVDRASNTWWRGNYDTTNRPALALARVRTGDEVLWAVRSGDGYAPLGVTLSQLLGLPREEARATVERAAGKVASDGIRVDGVLAPVDATQEVWAAGVTYLRSRDGRIEEATDGSPYDRVYVAERPELFFKATGRRVVAQGEPVLDQQRHFAL